MAPTAVQNATARPAGARWPGPIHKPQRPTEPGLRQTLYDVIFESDTAAGRLFDIALMIAILASICVVALETVPRFRDAPLWPQRFFVTELVFSVLFGVEYGVRLYCSRYRLRYVISFWGVIDLLSFLPTLLLGFSATSPRAFMILRSIRLLRVFRILKLWRMMRGADELSWAVWQSRDKVVVFLAVVLVAITISSTLMYHVEYDQPAPGESASGFTSIPQAMYWAIVTMTTVGYGDIVPTTTAGKFIAAALILCGYSLIIVPTGFVSAELVAFKQQRASDSPLRSGAGDATSPVPESAERRACVRCDKGNHAEAANFCDFCGTPLPPSAKQAL